MNILRISILVLFAGSIIFLSGCKHVSKSEKVSTDGIDISDLRDAVVTAVSALNDQPPGSPGESYILASALQEDYILTSAQQLIVDSKYVWLITFKPKSLHPEDPSKDLIGAGGEIFVTVDLAAKTTIITGGE